MPDAKSYQHLASRLAVPLNAAAISRLHRLPHYGKSQQVTDIYDLTNITLHIGGNIVGQPLVSRNLPVINPWVGALPEQGKKIIRNLGEALQFFKIRGQQDQQATPSGERLGQDLRYAKMLRAGENKTAWRWTFIDFRLQPAFFTLFPFLTGAFAGR